MGWDGYLWVGPSIEHGANNLALCDLRPLDHCTLGRILFVTQRKQIFSNAPLDVLIKKWPHFGHDAETTYNISVFSNNLCPL